jgi:drug/metabolite transporter (DMT)-like permease
LVSLKLATRENRSVIVVWTLAAVGTVASLAAGLVQRDWVLPDPHDGLLMLGTGLLSGAAQLLATAGYRAMDMSEAAVFSYLSPLMAVGVDALLWRRSPTAAMVAGGGLIVAAGVWMALAQQRRTEAA